MIDKLVTSPASSEDSESSLHSSPLDDDTLKIFECTPSRKIQLDKYIPAHTKARRLRANDRERRRVHLINRGMDALRSVVPGLKDKRKLTKLELLKSAYNYIWLLDEALRTGRTIEELTTPPEPTPIVYYVTYQMPAPYMKRETKPFIDYPDSSLPERPYMGLQRDINSNYIPYQRDDVDRPMISHQIDTYDRYMNNHLDKSCMDSYGDFPNDSFLDLHGRDFYSKPFLDHSRSAVCAGHLR